MQSPTIETNIVLTQALQAGSANAEKNLQAAGRSLKQQQIEQAAQEFEAVFITEMMKPMFEGLSTEAPFGGGKGEEVFRDMLLQEYGKKVAQTGTIGIADHVKEQMIRLQEQVDNANKE
jgi:Rod binding domain-containing protein